MREDDDQGFMLLMLAVVAAVLITVVWYGLREEPSSSAAPAESTEVVTAEPTEAPVTEPPATAVPATEVPGTEVPATEVFATAVPATEAADDATPGPLELRVTAEDGKLTLEGLVDTEALRQGIGSDAANVVGADNVVNLIEISDRVSLDAGVITGVFGSVENEDTATNIRDLAGIGSGLEVEVTDELVVVEPADIAGALNTLVAFNPIQFESGSSTIEAASLLTLDGAVTVLTENPTRGVLVEAHTDDQGEPAANQALSDSRAEAVVAYLIEQGVDPDQLEARGFGGTEPIADNATEDGRAENRRIAFSPLEG